MALFELRVKATYIDHVTVEADSAEEAIRLVEGGQGLTGDYVVNHDQDVDPDIEAELVEDE